MARVQQPRTVRRPELDESALQQGEVDFEYFDVDEAVVRGESGRGVRGEGSLRHCLLVDVDLSEAQLSNVDIANAVLRNVDLSNTSLQVGSARQAELDGCRAIGLRVVFARVADLYAQECRLDYAVVEIGRVSGLAVFQDCSLREATITGDLSNVSFTDCDLTGAEFVARRAEHCDLRGSTLAGTRGLLTLRGASISADQAIAAADALATEAGLRIVD